jgi:hypothetical protein
VKIRTFALKLFFLIALLATQQIAVMHGISHVQPQSKTVFQEEVIHGDVVCEQCLALCSLTSAVSGLKSLDLSDFLTHLKIPRRFVAFLSSATFRPFNIRAPPYL